MSDRQPYKIDLSDERWALIEPVSASRKAQHPSVSGHQGAYEMREIVNALLYHSRTGCQWDYLPHDLLRWQVRESRGRKADPSLVVLDTQSLHAAVGVPADTTGRDAAKKVPGRKRGLAVDVLGLVIAVVVLAAFKTTVIDHGQKVGIDVEVVERNPAASGFVPQPKRWVVEQVNGIMMLHRRLVRDYEHRPASAESRVYWAISDRMARMLTSTSTPTWRGA
ncbi:transposase [Streptomyces bobili]|uniref:transposase n=1 Tax=Streptomyces bobili TaxID=67280 RepID=UPI0038308FD1